MGFSEDDRIRTKQKQEISVVTEENVQDTEKMIKEKATRKAYYSRMKLEKQYDRLNKCLFKVTESKYLIQSINKDDVLLSLLDPLLQQIRERIEKINYEKFKKQLDK